MLCLPKVQKHNEDPGVMMISKKISLFDMDGTLTKPRERIQADMIQALSDLSKFSEVGIVSGSDLPLIKEQVVQYLLEDLKKSMILFPCNGTQAYNFIDNTYQKVYSTNMISEIGKNEFFDLFKFLLKQQKVTCDDNPDILINGNFIENRGSMLNYCIPGRSSSSAERKRFEFIDFTRSIREHILTRIKAYISRKKISLSASIGGKTSIDIYPKGWDKTYVMNHLNDYDPITFVGDKCDGTGNDKELYNLQDHADNLICFKTSSPEETIDIIYQRILPMMSKV